MDCGIPFCMQGCPLGNRIPAFNDDVYRASGTQAADQLFAHEQLPGVHGTALPGAVRVGVRAGHRRREPVTIERIEYEVAEHAFASGLRDVARPARPRADVASRSSARGRRAWPPRPSCAAPATRSRSSSAADAIGGLLRYGIPEFKMEKAVLDRRLEVMRHAGVVFHSNVTVGAGGTPLADLQRNFDAVLLAIGSTTPRMIPAPGADLVGRVPGHDLPRGGQPRGARRRDVADRRRRAATSSSWAAATPARTAWARRTARARRRSPRSRSWTVRPTSARPTSPGPRWPDSSRRPRPTRRAASGDSPPRPSSSAGTATLAEIVVRDHLSGEVVVVAGRPGADRRGLPRARAGHALGLDVEPFVTARETLAVGQRLARRGLPGPSPVFACGDAVRGQSLIVWAIAEGRSAAAAIDAHLARRAPPALPSPVAPYASRGSAGDERPTL